MEIQVFNKRGKIIAGKNFVFLREYSDLPLNMAGQEPELYFVYIMIDDIVNTKKITLN
jgi:hypothetical protein